VTLLGIDPEREKGFTFVDLDTIDGRFLDDVADTGIVIGRRLAERLETEVGKRVVIMSQDADNEVADRGFRVVGVYRASLTSYEDKYVLIGRQTAQKLLGIGDHVTEAVVMGDDYRDVSGVRAEVESLFAGVDDIVINDWMELDRYLATTLSAMDGFVLIWVVIIFLALSFGLVNTLIMAVFERVREIGVMLALGMKPAAILWQIVIESMLLLALGLMIGNELAWVPVLPIRDGIDISIVSDGLEMWGMSNRLVPDLRLRDVALANSVVIVLGFLASILPAWRASHYEPVEAITKVE